MRRVLSTVTLSALVAGCGNMKTRVIDLSAPVENSAMPGVPFTLNKPEFTIVRTPGMSGSDRYAMTTSYVPDPTRRFATSVHPFITASIDWTLTLDESGSFSDSNVKATDQTVPFLASAGKLAVSIAALDSFKQDAATSLSKIDGDLQTNFVSTTPQIFDEGIQALRLAAPAEAARLQSAWAAMLPRLLARAKLGTLADYGYQSADERTVLLTALRLDPAGHRKLSNGLVARIYLRTYSGAADSDKRDALTRIVDAFDRYDRQSLTAIKAAASKSRNELVAHMRQLNISTDQIEGDRLVRFQADLGNASKNAIGSLDTPPYEVIFSITDVTTAEWAGRRIIDLNRAVETRLVVVRAEASANAHDSNIENVDPVLASLYRSKAAVLGMTSQYDQALALDRVPPTDAKAFKEAQESRAVLLKHLADAEAALVVAKATPVADAPVVAEYLQGSARDVPDGQWVKDRTKGLPEYVIVLMPTGAPSGTIATTLKPAADAAPPPQSTPVQTDSGKPGALARPDAVPLPLPPDMSGVDIQKTPENKDPK